MTETFGWRGVRRPHVPLRYTRTPKPPTRPAVQLELNTYVRVVQYAISEGLTNKEALDRMVNR